MLKHIITLLSFTILVVAGSSQCDTGTIMCCDNDPSSDAAEYFAQGGIVKRRAKNECSAFNVIGTSQACDANQEPMCCEENKTILSGKCSPSNAPLVYTVKSQEARQNEAP
ncbi:hypothetical protein DEU56DRAFT_755198 [Suillus clintonianus]|uniref:uncharacterized protein n=1 Tax=Suillus clintonianus TaxID=1904413 RepID=UPI001B8799C9|nr:uncharacterized protein DEU56DRAFT_755198 [Suillus clintonianus]KAG2140579.1 hypothetical protein DEU56DRAFT_755198 [Suillus clintonianus]